MRQCLAPSGRILDDLIFSHVNAQIEEGRQTFFSHLLDEEAFWGSTLTFHSQDAQKVPPAGGGIAR